MCGLLNYGKAKKNGLILNKHFVMFQMIVDGNYTDMPGDYPMFEAKNNKNYFLFRIPKFTSMILIDPTVSVGVEEEASTTAQTTPKSSASTLAFNFFALLLSVAAMLKL